MGALRRQRHPILLIVILAAVLAWLAGAIWALWDSTGLQAAAEWRLGQFLGAPPLTLASGAQAQVGVICFSTLMAATLLACAAAVARYGLPGDKPSRLDAARPVL